MLKTVLGMSTGATTKNTKHTEKGVSLSYVTMHGFDLTKIITIEGLRAKLGRGSAREAAEAAEPAEAAKAGRPRERMCKKDTCAFDHGDRQCCCDATQSRRARKIS